jgi:adenosylcobinamide-GDP ribazoletransferase
MPALYNQFMLCWVFFTRIVVPWRLNLQHVTLSHAVWALPIIGGIIGGILAVVHMGLHKLNVPPLAIGFILLLLQLYITGGLHEDGLADTADGLAAHRTPAQKLAIMRDSHIGTYGMLAVLAIVGLRVALWANASAGAIIVAAMGSRTIMLWCMRLPPARPDGITSTLRPTYKTIIAGSVITCIVWGFIMPWGIVCAILVAGIIIYYAARRLFKRHFGGITGDTLGAVQQVSEAVILLIR